MVENSGTDAELQRVTEDVARYRKSQSAEALISRDFKAAVLKAITFFASGLLFLAIVTPFWEIEVDDEDAEPYNVLSSAFGILGYRDEDGDSDGLGTFFGLALLVLTVVILATIVQLLRMAAAGDFLRSGAVKTTVSVLLALGVLGAWATSSLADDWSWQPALPLMTLGALLAIPLLANSTTNT